MRITPSQNAEPEVRRPVGDADPLTLCGYMWEQLCEAVGQFSTATGRMLFSAIQCMGMFFLAFFVPILGRSFASWTGWCCVSLLLPLGFPVGYTPLFFFAGKLSVFFGVCILNRVALSVLITNANIFSKSVYSFF